MDSVLDVRHIIRKELLGRIDEKKGGSSIRGILRREAIKHLRVGERRVKLGKKCLTQAFLLAFKIIRRRRARR